MVLYPVLESVSALDGYRLMLHYANHETRIYEFKSNLTHSFYAELTNPLLFKRVRVKNGEIIWSTGQDFCPHTLYESSVLLEN